MRKKRDILFLCQFFYPEYVSSATLPFDTAKALNEAGFSVGVLCGFPKEYSKGKNVPQKEDYSGIKIHRLKYIQLKRSNVIGRLINYFSFTLSVFLRLNKIKNYKSIIVYSNPPILPLIASLANKLYGTKIIFVSYDVYPEIAIRTKSIKEKSLISFLMNFINGKLYKRITKVVALSHDMKDFLLKNRKHLLSEQVDVIPNWYENKPLEDVEHSYCNKLFAPIKAKNKLIVSYFGNMGVAQDLTTLLEAIKILNQDSEIAFIFAGHGVKLASLKEIIENESLQNVYIYDFLHDSDFQDALNISDVFIVSLEKGLTGLAVPSKTYSYMMAGKPIISIMNKHADISKDLVENDAGFSIEVGDVEQLVSTINTLNKDKEVRERLGNNARKLFESKYTTEKSTSKYVHMMKHVLEEGSNV